MRMVLSHGRRIVTAVVLAVACLVWATPARAALVAYYNFDGTANDLSSRGLHGTLVGGSSFSMDVPAQLGGGQSVLFDGSTGYVDLGNPAALDFGTANWTVAGWINATETADSDRGTLYSNGGDDAGGIRYTLTQNEANNGTLRLITDDNTTKHEATSTTVTNNAGWHHIAGVRDGGVIRLYVNGSEESVVNLSGGTGYDLGGTSQQPAQIGAGRSQDNGGAIIKQLNGLVDDVAVWGNALAPATISQLASGTLSPLNAPLPPVAPLPATRSAAFSYSQTDETTGSGTITAFSVGSVNGAAVLSAASPQATVAQIDPNTGGVTLPAGAVGFITGGDDAAPGGDTGVYVGGITGTASPSASIGPDTYAVDVPLELTAGNPGSYSFDVFDDPAQVDVVGSQQFVGYMGDQLSGHRHTGDTRTFAAGADSDFADASFGLGGDANGDAIGIAAGARTPFIAGATIFVDNVDLSTQLTAQMNTFTRNGSPVSAPSGDDLFDIHVDIGAEGHRIQPGHIGVIGAPHNTNNVDGFGVIDTGVGVISVMIDDTDASGADVGGIDWRDRGNSSNGAADLVQLGEDFIKNNLGIIRLTLFGLPAGRYEMTSYHIDPDNAQAEDIDIFLDTGEGFFDTDAMAATDFDVGGVNSLTTDNILGTSATFSFLANGADNVTILFDSSQAADDEVPLNGFRLNFQGAQIPEPATGTLGLLAMGALAMRARRRRAA